MSSVGWVRRKRAQEGEGCRGFFDIKINIQIIDNKGNKR